jgi:hypothetical protein
MGYKKNIYLLTNFELYNEVVRRTGVHVVAPPPGPGDPFGYRSSAIYRGVLESCLLNAPPEINRIDKKPWEY